LFLLPAKFVLGEPGSTEDSIKEIERRQFEIEKKLREKEKSEKEKDESLKEKEREGMPPISDDNKFFIREIILQNDELLSWREKRNLLEPYTNKEITYNDITILVRSITNVLIDKGYITARVKIPLDQNLNSGEIIITIVNGYIEDIVPEKDGFRQRLQVFMAFPFMEGDYLNIEDLDYGVEQMNKLGSNNASMKVMPAEELGFSKIVIYNETGDRLTVNVGFDNLGQETTGEQRYKISAGFDNLLSINDNIYFDYTGSANTDQDRKYNRVYTLNFTFPIGLWSLSTTYSRSEYMQYTEGLNTEFKSSGTDISKALGIDWMIGRIKDNRFKAKSSLTLKEKENFIEDAIIESSSRNLSVLKIGMDYTTFLFGGYFQINSYYYRGLKYFDAYKDSGEMGKDVPRAQFNKYELGITWNKPFAVFNRNFTYAFSSSGQYAIETLYSSEKISVGDLYTVRGFKGDSISGDNGFYLRNDISLDDLTFIWKYLSGLRIFTGYDYGYIVENVGMEANYGRGEASVMGWSAGVNYSMEYLSANITYARQLFSPWFIPEKDHVVYFSFTIPLNGFFNGIWNSVVKNSGKEE
jgi:hemolysin activation/secretion protein